MSARKRVITDMAKLNAAARKKISKKKFGVPSKAPGSGSYPMPDRSHAVNAMARASGKGVEAQVRAKAHKLYPGLKSYQYGGTVPGTGPVPIMAHGGETIIPAPSTREQQGVQHFGKAARTEGAQHRASRSAYFSRRARGRSHP